MQDEQLFGMSVIGERGQIVIPAKARESFDIKAGDEMIFFGHKGKMMHMIKATELRTFLEKMSAKTANLQKLIDKKAK